MLTSKSELLAVTTHCGQVMEVVGIGGLNIQGSKLKWLVFSVVRRLIIGDKDFVFKSQVCPDTQKSALELRRVLQGIVPLIIVFI